MEMHIFFCEQPAADKFMLDQVESNHLSRVLRLKKGDPVSVINGDGNLYLCSVEVPDARKAVVTVDSIERNFDRRNNYLHIAIAPTKNMDRFETFVEKVVELGIDEISPIVTSRSERHKVRTDRIAKIIVSAMKQSLKSSGTIINEPVDIGNFTGAKREGQLFIAHCIEDISTEFMGNVCKAGGKVTILIGPEGDFTRDEVEEAIKRGYISINLGKSRLRTETAGIAACSQVYFINQGELS